MTGIKTHCTVCNRPTPEQPSWAHVQSWMWRNGWKGENRAIIGTIKENRAIDRGEIPCRQCFACTRRWMFEDSRRNLNEVGLRRYIEMNEIEICEYRRRELYGEDEK